MTNTEINIMDMISSYSTYDEYQKAELANMFDRAINSFGFGWRELGDAIIRNKIATYTMSQVVVCWMQALEFAYNHHMYDDRNMYCTKMSTMIPYKSLLFDKIKKYGFKNEDDLKYCMNCFNSKRMFEDRPMNIGQYIAMYMIKNHRTLQQTFSNLVFYLIAKWYDVSLNEDTKWYHCPCI